MAAFYMLIWFKWAIAIAMMAVVLSAEEDNYFLLSPLR